MTPITRRFCAAYHMGPMTRHSNPIITGPGNTPWTVLAIATMLTGVAAGIGGMLVALLLHLVQHIAYDYSLGSLIGSKSFLEGVSASSPARRFIVLLLCGFVAGIGWLAVYRFGRPLVSVRKAVNSVARMPPLTTAAHVLLQTVTVAMGSPLGREVAPREIGALLATNLSGRLRLGEEEGRILIACGAGGGLAAVYNVPFGAALFILETLLGTFRFAAVLPAITTSVIAAYVARLGLGNHIQYSLPNLVMPPPLVIRSIITGPIFGLAAWWFAKATSTARARAPRGWRLLVCCIAVFTAIGAFAIPFPEILGNGKGIAQMGFAGDLSIELGAILLVIRAAITIGCLCAGAEGGLLTPSVAMGTLLATVIGGAWSLAWPGVMPGAFAVVGAAAFVAVSMKMPMTAVALILEFTRVGPDFIVPVLFAVAGSVSVGELCALRERKKNELFSAETLSAGPAPAPDFLEQRGR